MSDSGKESNYEDSHSVHDFVGQSPASHGGESPEEADSIAEYQGFNDNASEHIRTLARTLTNQSQNASFAESSQDLIRYLSHMSQVPGVAPFDGVDPQLDPNSDEFNAKFWVKNLRKLLDSDPDYYKHSSLGIAYRDLRARGIATDSDYQPTVTNFLWKLSYELYNMVRKPDESRYFDILKPMDAIMKPGEVTVVLGRPGSGCSTLLKTIAAHDYGFKVSPESRISYNGMTPNDIKKHHRGDVIFSAETDVHFANLLVGDTLEFAARMRTPQNRGSVSREDYAKHMAAVYMATYGLSHTRFTRVGNDYVRGVSGGERKRVSIAEASLSGANIQCWDNATRGLDAATALEFIRALKTSATILDATPLIAIYQCSQDAYDLFDNVCVLYEGYQIFYGKGKVARKFFEDMGYICPQRQTTADFLTSITNPAERIIKPGFEDRVPRTSKDFETYWKNSPEYANLIAEIEEYMETSEKENHKQLFHEAHVAKQAKRVPAGSSYTVSFAMQTKYVMQRNILRLKGDPSISIFSIFMQAVMGLILSSVFYNLSQETDSFYYRGASIFFAVLFNAFSSLLEIMALFEARPIVEKHKQYALYRPAADALASIITELPTKFLMSMSFNVTFYFMVNLRRDAGRFFFYWLMGFSCTLVMSHIFRSIGAVSTSLPGAMTPASVLLLAMIIFTGFVIPTPKMLGWSRWINYINPVAYVFESLMDNEFSERIFKCYKTKFIPNGPDYSNIGSSNRVCSTTGSIAGQNFVNGTNYLSASYEYYNSHKWRNFGITVGFIIFFLGLYILLTELNKGAMQKGEIVLFLQGDLKKHKKARAAAAASKGQDLENNLNSEEKLGLQDEIAGEISEETDIEKKLVKNENIFHWKDLTYQVKIKTEDRVLLNHIDGWVKPGQLTALMGSSGAGKTTLLNCLSERLTSGVITDGSRMVNGHALDSSFQRSIGYAQQQDLHLETSTVRGALRFSAYLRQPAHVSKKEKDEYVEYCIDLLEMTPYADALVGVAGEGLNVEQRKRLTIGVELAAKPKLLLFLDEPTSGLDSQTAWSVCKLMRKLADHGQAILCTIHQPSAILLQEFDRLLFLQKGGQTVYFGGLGENCSTLTNYFEKYGADPCPPEANPAEWMLHVVGAAPGSHAKQDYFDVWRNSTEYAEVRKELEYMETELVKLPKDESADSHKTYAAGYLTQYLIVSQRVLQQHWRNPWYIYSKIFLVVSSSLFNGFSFFKADTSEQGLQNQMFAIFMSLIPLITIIQQLLPFFVSARSLYEVRESPSRTYSWIAFIGAQITGEIPFNFAVGTLSFFCWYYPLGLYRNAEPTDTVHERGALVWLFLSFFYVYAGTMAQWAMSFNELADNAANLAAMLFTMCLNFCGVLAGPDFLPGFWIFMYRANPMTYLIQGILSAGLANTEVVCGAKELLHFDPPSGQTCGDYMSSYISTAGGNVINPSATEGCKFCTMKSTNAFLASVSSVYSERWRNFGIFIGFIAINIIGTVFCYWLARVPKDTLIPVRDRMEELIRFKQKQIAAALQALEPQKTFHVDEWDREDGKGGGVTMVLQDGKVIEKAGIGISIIHGVLPPAAVARMKVNHKNLKAAVDGTIEFKVCGLSMIVHCTNPHAPTVHLNYRYFQTSDPETGKSDAWWFGGGADLTPTYLYEDDAKLFHQCHKDALDKFDVSLYPKYKSWCDEYFYIKHRNEARGIGGIFFDDVDIKSADELLLMVNECLGAFLAAYIPILARRIHTPFTDAEKHWQQVRRGRYVEFNLVIDRGTQFGLQTPGARIESILMSLPLNATWIYDHHPEPGSREEQLVEVLKNPKQWI
ncbi:Multidrug resistance protein [Yamadazyma tenuis]|uniref:Multidrug resistance protein n=1 Tax=Candida tenuis TaxID=2315449 RepID=UPI0027A89EE7|nr:Multidrug resistance protein [Yamadazyma tenuis]